MSSPLLSVEGVHKRYATHHAVRGVSFSVGKGEVFGLLGGNGAGKTTTMRIINGVIAADEGVVKFEGVVPNENKLRQLVGYLPEERGLYPRMRALETVIFFARLRGLSASAAKESAQKLLTQLELWEWRGHRVSELSKGMQQKLQFCVALVHDPALVILDEPWSGLDPMNAAVLKELVERRREQGKAVLFSTHQLASAERLCDRVCIIANGAKIAEGTPSAVKTESTHGPRLRAEVRSEEQLSSFCERLQTLDSISEVTSSGKQCEAVVTRGVDAAAVLAQVAAFGVALEKLSLQEPSLEEAFVEAVTRAKGTAANHKPSEARDG